MSELKIEVAHNNFELEFMKFAAQLKVRNLKWQSSQFGVAFWMGFKAILDTIQFMALWS